MSQGGANSNSGSGGTPIEKLTGNSGGAVSPDGVFNIDILGSNLTGINVVGTPASNLLTIIGLAASTTQVGTVELATGIETGTLTDNARAVTPLSLEAALWSPFVVNSTGPYTTIQSAINAAELIGNGATVVVRPGQYTENLTFTTGDITLLGGVALGDEGQCEIIGVHTPPTTGYLVLRNFKLTSATDIFNSAAAGTARLVIIDALLSLTNGYTFNVPNWSGTLELFDINDNTSTNDGAVNNPTGGATINFYEIGIGNGSGNTMQTSGSVTLFDCEVGCPLNLNSGSNLFCDNSLFAQNITFSGNSTGYIQGSHSFVDGVPAITMSSSANVGIYNTVFETTNNPCISGAGAGTLELANVIYLNNSSVAGTLTLSHLSTTEGGIFYGQTINVGARSPSNPYNIAIEDSVAGTIGESIQNTLVNVSAASTYQAIVEPLAGDPYSLYNVNGAATFSLGIDNSDSDQFKITTGSTPSGGTTAINITSAGLVTLPGGALDVPSGGTGATTLADHGVLVGSGTGAITAVGPVASTGALLASNGVGSDPGFTTATYPLTTTINEILFSSAANTVTGLTTANRAVLTTGATGIPALTAIATDGQFIIGSTAGAPAAGTITSTGATITVTPGSNTINLEAVNTGDVSGPGSSTDNALARWDGAAGDTLQNSTVIVTDAGEMTNASQPAFLALLGSTDLNATGDATTYTLGGTTALTEIFDQNSDFNTNGTFTAPVTGRYYLSAHFRVDGLTSFTSGFLQIITSNRTFRWDGNGTASTTVYYKSVHAVCDMDASDTATFTVTISDTGGKVDDVVGNAAPRTWCEGFLVC